MALPAAPRGIGQWAVWALPSRLLSAVIAIDLLAVLLVAVDIVATPFSSYSSTAIASATFAIGGILHAEISLRIERMRRRVVGGDMGHIDLTSVWTFAAALLLPPAVAAAMVVTLYLYLQIRVWRPTRTPIYRLVFTIATLVLATHAAAAAAAYVGRGEPDLFSTGLGPVAIVTALLAYTVVNTCLVVGAVVLSANRTVRQVLGHGDEVVLEVATLSLGAMVALAMSAGGPWLVVFVFPPLLVLHRAVLVRQLEQAANTDSKTGLLTAAAWHLQATRHLQRAHDSGTSAGVLILDLDHFKRVNDTYGHLAGDTVLQAVASAVRGEVRDGDLSGRFGGEEFVVMLPRPESTGYDYAELRRIAERIRTSVAGLGIEIPTPDGPLTIADITVSIGGAIFPDDGAHVQDLVAVADSALYAAKRAGRNRVRLGPHRAPAPEPVVTPTHPT